MFKHASIYRIKLPQPMLVETLNTMLDVFAHQPIGATQDRSIGWVPPRGHENGPLVENVGGQLILRLMIETKTVPAAALRDAVAANCAAIEAQTGVKIGKKARRELSDELRVTMLPHAFPQRAAFWVWIDPAAGMMVADSASQSRLDDITSAIVHAIDGTVLQHIETEVSPAATMAHWLAEGSPTFDPFLLGRACQLKACDETKAVVRYSRHNLDTQEIRDHIKAGKMPTKLALEWGDRVAFTLTDAGALTGIEFQDAVFEDAATREQADHFDADVAIATGELSLLIHDLHEAMGGLVVEGGAL